MRKTAIEGQVAAVLSSEELVINRGTYHGVAEGTRFAVLASEPLVVKDPETGEVLDEVLREKVRVEVTEARERSSTCATFGTTWTKNALAPNIPAEFYQKSMEVPITFRSPDVPEPLAASDRVVRIGDKVRETGKPAPTTRMSLYDRERSRIGSPPTPFEEKELEKVHQFLVEEGVNPAPKEFTFEFLQSEVYRKGFEYKTHGRPGDWNSDVWSLSASTGPREPATSEHFWDQESSLAFALHRALRR